MTTRSSIKINFRVHYFPYHKVFIGNHAKIIDRFGRVLFIDGHSYPLTCFPFERFPNDLRPEVDIGTRSISYTKGTPYVYEGHF